MPQPNDLSRSLIALDQNSTIIAVVEMSQSSWLIGGLVPGIERQPRQKLEPSPEQLLAVLHRWRDEAVRAGRTITRIAVAPCSSQGQAPGPRIREDDEGSNIECAPEATPLSLLRISALSRRACSLLYPCHGAAHDPGDNSRKRPFR